MTTDDDGLEVPIDASALGPADLGLLELLACLALAARRHGARIRLRHPTPALLALLEATGLSEALGASRTCRREPIGEPEEREPTLGVEERVHLDDLAV